jgi:hypothetical protein
LALAPSVSIAQTGGSAEIGMVGGVTNITDVLIPKLKGFNQPSHFQANLVQFAFFHAQCTFFNPRRDDGRADWLKHHRLFDRQRRDEDQCG